MQDDLIFSAPRDPPLDFVAHAKDKTKDSKDRIRRALVVDDTVDIANLFEVVLSQAGYQTTTLQSGFAALEAAKQERFDLVISDIGMPGMNGYDLAIALRALPEYETVPMIAVTGFAQYSNRNDALACGFNAQLIKPVDLAALLDLVGELQD
jgi:two-component system CheB/CheR fusion protein